MKKSLIVLAALAATAAFGAPASAANLATLGDIGFSYGTLTDTGFKNYSFMPTGSDRCLGLGDCYVGDDKYAIIAQAPTAGQLLVHPGPGTPGGVFGNSAVAFTAGKAGDYAVNATATSADSGGKTVGYFTIIGGTLKTFASGSISGSGSQAITQTVALGLNDRLGVFVNNGDGTYFNDSTNFAGSIAAVPEPATWAMMIGGLGMVGGSLRRRRGVTTRVAYA